MACLSDETLAAYVDGQLPDDQASEARLHIGECSSCRELLAALTRAQLGDANIPEGSGPKDASPMGTDALFRGVNVGRYVVLEMIGIGGMGVVYSAYDPVLERKIALKFLRLSRVKDEARGIVPEALTRRLQREARAMARLSHRNVVALFDTGTFEDQIYLAMEFVDGCTLADWYVAQQGTYKPAEVMALFRQIGAGLMAAHEVGIVHRDFKPTNVLVSKQGVARVTDFGLARLLSESDETPDRSHAAALSPAEWTPLTSLTLTNPKVLIGTPSYMSPEQYAGLEADARSDQWSFCVVLYEALYGERPFAGASVEELGRNIQLGTIRPPPHNRVPAELRRVILRGLSVDRNARYPNMATLLSDLEFDQKRGSRRLLTGVIGLTLLANLLVGGYLVRRSPDSSCRGAERKLVGVWDEDRRQLIRSAFLTASPVLANDAWRGVERALSAYARGFVQMYTETCEATHIRGKQSEQLLDLRMDCLEQRRKQLAALSDLFTQADGKLVQKSVGAALSLPDFDLCANRTLLQRRDPPSPDPKIRAHAEELSMRLARVRAGINAGQYPEALTQAQALLPEARSLGQAGLLTEVLYLTARIQHNLRRDYSQAEETYYQALWSAESAHDDELSARIWISILDVLPALKDNDSSALRVMRHTEAAIARAGKPANLLAEYKLAQANLSRAQGQYRDAISYGQDALDFLEKTHRKDDLQLMRCLPILAQAHTLAGLTDKALSLYQRALSIAEKNLGPAHPEVGELSMWMGDLLREAGRPKEGLARIQRGLSILQRVYDPSNYNIGMAHCLIGAAHGDLGNYRQAIDSLSQCLRIVEQTLGPEHTWLVIPLRNLAEYAAKAGEPEQAIQLVNRALRIAQKAHGDDHPKVAIVLVDLGDLHRMRGELKKSEAYYQRALAIRAQFQQDSPKELMLNLLGLAETYVDLHQTAQAVPLLERALGLSASDSADMVELRAKIQSALTRSLPKANKR